jgi:cytochrome b pre-mRNA-processing protein 3
MIGRDMLGNWFKAGPQESVRRLYGEIIEQARRPDFYESLGVPDSLDGRFELISLHAILVMKRLRTLGPQGEQAAQELFDLLFADMDASLREMGVGDLGVGKRVKAMAEAFYGRALAYDEALCAVDPTSEQGDRALRQALRRNLYGPVADLDESGPPAAVARYMRAAERELMTQDGAALLAGVLAFPEPRVTGPEGAPSTP